MTRQLWPTTSELRAGGRRRYRLVFARETLEAVLFPRDSVLALALTAATAIFPIVVQICGLRNIDSGLWASLLVGVAAALLGLDKVAKATVQNCKVWPYLEVKPNRLFQSV